ncbi:hypothetical protein BHM03_00010742 [Ensete ventricosum]|nr:hypothetical protein BHM03_00010742 [Ensete ventricosum]
MERVSLRLLVILLALSHLLVSSQAIPATVFCRPLQSSSCLFVPLPYVENTIWQSHDMSAGLFILFPTSLLLHAEEEAEEKRGFLSPSISRPPPPTALPRSAGDPDPSTS